jgi:hypothetical protein
MRARIVPVVYGLLFEMERLDVKSSVSRVLKQPKQPQPNCGGAFFLRRKIIIIVIGERSSRHSKR